MPHTIELPKDLIQSRNHGKLNQQFLIDSKFKSFKIRSIYYSKLKRFDIMKAAVYALLAFLLFFGTFAQTFDYTDQQNWGGSCQEGMYQSPIDIDSSKVSMCPDWGYEKITVECEDFDQYFVTDDAGIENIGNVYIFYYHELQNWYEAYRSTGSYWYTTSEHHINGESYDAEMEILLEAVQWTDIPAHARGIHADLDLSQVPNDALLNGVVASSMRLLFKVDGNAQAVDFSAGIRPGAEEGDPAIMNINNMFGCVFDQYFYIYEGSSTVPFQGEECRQKIWVYVTRKPLPIKPQTLAFIKQNILYEENTNHRDLQELGDRDVMLTGRPCHAEEDL